MVPIEADVFMIDGANPTWCSNLMVPTLMVPPHEADVDVMVDGFMIDGASGDGVINRRAMSSPKTIMPSIVVCEYESRYD